MAQIVYRGNLSAARFPFISEWQGRTVIVSGYDNTYVPVVASRLDEDKDRGIPQIYYCHNVMPTQQGFQSIGYIERVAKFLGVTFSAIFILRDDAGNKSYLGVTTNKFLYSIVSGAWHALGYYASTGPISTAYVNGVTYIWIPGVGCYTYDFAAHTLTNVVLTSLVIADILGITASSGYLIAWSNNTIAWSSTVDPTDFTPSLTTGAGSGAPQGAKGAITFCVPHTLGFIVYTSANCVAALYSGNSRFPFNFREIVSSGGCSSAELVSWDANTGNQYAYTSSGLQLISPQQAQATLPEITDFVSGQYIEDLDDTTLTFTAGSIVGPVMQKKLVVIADRYLVVSYGNTSLTHALVYDIAMRRYGKIKINHVDCFEYELLDSTQVETPKQAIAFLQVDGTIKTVDFSPTSSNAAGIIILGKFQYSRQRLITLEHCDLENVQQGLSFDAYNLVAVDGKNTTNYEGYLAYSSGKTRRYSFHKTGINHSLLFQGAFYLSSFVLYFNQNGRR